MDPQDQATVIEFIDKIAGDISVDIQREKAIADSAGVKDSNPPELLDRVEMARQAAVIGVKLLFQLVESQAQIAASLEGLLIEYEWMNHSK